MPESTSKAGRRGRHGGRAEAVIGPLRNRWAAVSQRDFAARAIVAGILLLPAVPLCAAEKEIGAPPPPLAVSANVSLYRGKTATISLRAAGRTPGEVKFIIRSQPKQGKLGQIRRLSRTTAAVAYEHDDSSAGEDAFTFAVQAEDSPVSAPGRVTLVISEEPAVLEWDGALDFGHVTLGEARTREITLRNAGGGVLAGRARVSPPWRIEGPADFRLGRGGQEKTISIVFEPGEERDYRGKLTFDGVKEVSGELTGRGAQPFEFEPRHNLEFSHIEGSSDRAAELQVLNRTDFPRRVLFSGPDELVMPGEITLAPGQKSRVVFRTRSGFLADLSGRITVASEGYEMTLPFRVFSSPPVLAVYPGLKLDFGKVEIGKRHQKTITVANHGGADARLRAAFDKEILVIPNPGSIVLSSGEKKSFAVVLEPRKIGNYQGSIRLEAPGALPVDLSLAAQVRAGALPADFQKPKVLPVPPLPSERALSLPDNAQGNGFSKIPPIEDVALVESGKGRMVLSWKKPKGAGRDSRIEWRNVLLGSDGKVKVEWETWRDARFREQDGQVHAEIRDLPPGGTWFIRISARDEAGKWSKPTPTYRIATPIEKGWGIVPVIAGLIVLIAVGLVIGLIRRQRREEEQRDLERIQRLGKS